MTDVGSPNAGCHRSKVQRLSLRLSLEQILDTVDGRRIAANLRDGLFHRIELLLQSRSLGGQSHIEKFDATTPLFDVALKRLTANDQCTRTFTD